MNYSQKNYITSYIIPAVVGGVLILALLAPLASAQEATSTDAETNTSTTTNAKEVTPEDPDTETKSVEEDSDTETVEEAQLRLQEIRNNVIEQRDRLLSPLRRDEASDKDAAKRAEIVRTQAQNASTTRDELREDRVEIREVQMEERQTERVERQEERRSRLDAHVEARVRAYGERLERRYNAAIERLEGIALRIETRIEKLNERGIDTSEAERELQEAYGAIAAAQSQVGAAAASLEEILVSDSPRDALNESKILFQSAKETIRDAHGALVESIALLKASIENQTDEASDEE